MSPFPSAAPPQALLTRNAVKAWLRPEWRKFPANWLIKAPGALLTAHSALLVQLRPELRWSTLVGPARSIVGQVRFFNQGHRFAFSCFQLFMYD